MNSKTPSPQIWQSAGRFEAVVWTSDDGSRWLRKSFPTHAEAVAWVNKKRK